MTNWKKIEETSSELTQSFEIQKRIGICPNYGNYFNTPSSHENNGEILIEDNYSCISIKKEELPQVIEALNKIQDVYNHGIDYYTESKKFNITDEYGNEYRIMPNDNKYTSPCVEGEVYIEKRENSDEYIALSVDSLKQFIKVFNEIIDIVENSN